MAELPNLKINVPTVVSKERKFLNDKEISEKRKLFREKLKNQYLNLLIVGQNGTGKTGLALSFLSKLPKKKMIIDLDGGCIKLIRAFYPNDESIEVYDVMDEDKYYKDENGIYTVNSSGYFYDYQKILTEILSLIGYCHKHKDEYSGICFDGISIFLKFCEYLMKDEKHLDAMGSFNQQYWKLRYKYFSETMQSLRAVPIHRIYIGHDDMITKEDSTLVRKNFNDRIDERIITKRIKNINSVVFTGEIDKVKGKPIKEGRKFTFLKVNPENYVWSCDEIFKEICEMGVNIGEKNE